MQCKQRRLRVSRTAHVKKRMFHRWNSMGRTKIPWHLDNSNRWESAPLWRAFTSRIPLSELSNSLIPGCINGRSLHCITAGVYTMWHCDALMSFSSTARVSSGAWISRRSNKRHTRHVGARDADWLALSFVRFVPSASQLLSPTGARSRQTVLLATKVLASCREIIPIGLNSICTQSFGMFIC